MISGHFLWCPNFSNDFILFLKILKVFQSFPDISKVFREYLGTSLHLIKHHHSLNSIFFKNSNKSNQIEKIYIFNIFLLKLWEFKKSIFKLFRTWPVLSLLFIFDFRYFFFLKVLKSKLHFLRLKNLIKPYFLIDLLKIRSLYF